MHQLRPLQIFKLLRQTEECNDERKRDPKKETVDRKETQKRNRRTTQMVLSFCESLVILLILKSSFPSNRTHIHLQTRQIKKGNLVPDDIGILRMKYVKQREADEFD